MASSSPLPEIRASRGVTGFRQVLTGQGAWWPVTHAQAVWTEEVLRFSLDLGQWQSLGLAFLLGSFTVATLSDLKRLSAQREFLEVWVIFTLGALAYEVWNAWMADWHLWQLVAIKWGLILLLGLMSWQKVGPIFRLARADVFACTAAAALLPPLVVLAFWALLKGLALVMKPLLARGRPYWPFMPVVSVAVLLAMLPSLVL